MARFPGLGLLATQARSDARACVHFGDRAYLTEGSVRSAPLVEAALL